MKKALIVFGAIVAAIVGGILFKEFQSDSSVQGGTRGGARAVLVEVSETSRQELTVRSEAVGTTFAKESVEITANVTETVESIHFEDGDRVKKGDVLVVLTNNEEQAELASAKANLTEQEREVNRLEGLVKSRSVPQSTLDERLTMRETAQHRVEAVEARLRDRTIRAPFAGVLGLRRISPGTLVGPGTIITTLDDVDLIKLDFAVPEINLTSVAKGNTIEARSPALGGQTFSGKIVSVDSRINPVDRSIKVRAELPNTNHAIKPGMLMNVDILVEKRSALTVPETAVFMRGEQHYVYGVADKDNPVAQLQPISVGVRYPGVVEVTGGLAEGDLVVIRGTATVSEGAALTLSGGEG